MKLLLIFFTAILAVQSETLESDWLKFKLHHEKNYAPSEDLLRFSIYQSNLKTIEAHNRKYYQGLVSYKMGINHFTDWTTEEFVKNLKKISTVHGGVTTNFKGDLPDAINWNEKGAVAPVKDQGQCGSSMIFSAVGTVEGANFVLNNKLVKFSEQCLIDCTGDACNGSNPEDVFKFIEEHGLPGEGNYPDPNVPGKCHYVDEDSSIHVNSWIRVEDGNETALQYATVVGGPVSVQIDATSLQFYISGIFDDDQCSSLNVNHAVLVVGYGREGNLDYWIVKNSWGTSWGEKGFIRMSRNKSNQCGIASMARVPILD